MRKLVHNREISIRTYDLGDNCISVEGSLIDHRHRLRHKETSGTPELVHHMVIRFKVKGPEMYIEKAEATMPHHPREECPVVLPWIRHLEGFRVTQGFSMKVKGAIGNTKGCSHLTNLVVAMGPSAVQGYWAAYGRGREEVGHREQVAKSFKNTCYLWREDGPLFKGFKED